VLPDACELPFEGAMGFDAPTVACSGRFADVIY
jgi:hypothetical protein